MTRDELIEYFQTRIDHADKNPVVPSAKNGDRNPITVDHAVMDQVLRLESFQAPGWAPLRKDRSRLASFGNISTEYPGLWIRSALAELKAASTPKKKGGE